MRFAMFFSISANCSLSPPPCCPACPATHCSPDAPPWPGCCAPGDDGACCEGAPDCGCWLPSCAPPSCGPPRGDASCGPAASSSRRSMVPRSISSTSSSRFLMSSITDERLYLSSWLRRCCRNCWSRSRKPCRRLPAWSRMPRCSRLRIACCRSPKFIRSSLNASMTSSASRPGISCVPSHSLYRKATMMSVLFGLSAILYPAILSGDPDPQTAGEWVG